MSIQLHQPGSPMAVTTSGGISCAVNLQQIVTLEALTATSTRIRLNFSGASYTVDASIADIYAALEQYSPGWTAQFAQVQNAASQDTRVLSREVYAIAAVDANGQQSTTLCTILVQGGATLTLKAKATDVLAVVDPIIPQ